MRIRLLCHKKYRLDLVATVDFNEMTVGGDRDNGEAGGRNQESFQYFFFIQRIHFQGYIESDVLLCG